MIFLTIGTHEPFDRLVEAMDRIAPEIPDTQIIAQLSSTSYAVTSKNIAVKSFVAPSEFTAYCRDAGFIIGHAGMGTIITALEMGKVIIVFPRKGDLKETRNNHQMATVKKLEAMNYIHVAYDEEQLRNLVLQAVNGSLKPLHKIGSYASPAMIEAVKQFIKS